MGLLERTCAPPSCTQPCFTVTHYADRRELLLDLETTAKAVERVHLEQRGTDFLGAFSKG